MKKEGKLNSYSLSRRIFLYLVGIAFFSVILLSILWIEGKYREYLKEVALLRKTYSESKRLETKNKILEIKDYIQWIQSSPLKPLAYSLTNQMGILKNVFLSNREIAENFPDSLPKAFIDSLSGIYIPFGIVDNYGKIVFSYFPDRIPFAENMQEEITPVFRKIQKHKQLINEVLPVYESFKQNDSILATVTYIDREILPGFNIISVINATDFEYILQEFMLDSLSKLRFTKEEYVFVNTLDGKALITNGKINNPPINIQASGDTAWQKVFSVQQSAASQPNGVFYSYIWQKLSTIKTSGKTSYFSYLPNWKWIIGTGFYEDDVNTIIEMKTKALYAGMRRTLGNALFYLLISSLLCYFLVVFFSRRLSKNISLFKRFFERASDDNLLIDKSQVSYREFLSMAEDANKMVEERKKALADLRKSEAYFRYLFEQNPALLMIYELGSLNILAVNDAFTSHYGYNMQEALSLKLTDLYPEEEKKPIADLAKKLTGLSYVGEWHHVKKDGTIIEVETHSHGLSFEGRNSRIAVINDITIRKKVEAEILQLNQELENRVNERTTQLANSNKELESFSYSISHDLRAPLRAIYGFSQILSSRHRNSLNEEGRQYMDYIVEASIRMERLINDMLDYSRLGRKSIKLHDVSLQHIVNSVLKDFSTLLNEAGGRLIITKELPVISGDETLLNQVFTNLVGNSIKYRRSDTPLIISISYESISEGLIIKVTDNGIGIPKMHWEKIFNVFQRLHNEVNYPGTGIGLATVKKVVNMLGGTIHVVSEEGKGSTFIIKFLNMKSDARTIKN